MEALDVHPCTQKCLYKPSGQKGLLWKYTQKRRGRGMGSYKCACIKYPGCKTCQRWTYKALIRPDWGLIKALLSPYWSLGCLARRPGVLIWSHTSFSHDVCATPEWDATYGLFYMHVRVTPSLSIQLHTCMHVCELYVDVLYEIQDSGICTLASLGLRCAPLLS